MRKQVLRGGNVTCCLCNQQYLTFLPSGDELKAHSRCPGCYSTDRNRQLWLTVKPIIDNSKHNLSLLHIAPELPLAAQLLKMKNVTYCAIDKFENGYNYPSFVKFMDLTRLNLKNDSFDLFICSHVLEHIIEDETAMKELHRVLKPNGIGLIMIPYFPELKTTYEDYTIHSSEQRKLMFGQADHVRKYGSDFTKKLNAVGFEVDILSIEKTYTKEEKVKLGLINAELIFKVKKITI